MDPSDGEVHKLEEREFLEAWTGYLITVRPGAGFLKGDTTTPFIRRIAGLVSLYKKEIIPSLAGSIIYVLTGLSISIFLQNIIDNIIPNSDTCSFGWYSSGIGILIALSVFIGYVRSLLTVRGSIKIDGTLILGYMHHILRLPLSFFHERSTGDINSRVNDIYRIRAFVSGKLVMISISAIALILSFFLLFTFYWKLAAMTMGFIPIYAAIYFFADKANKKNNKRIIEASAIFENSTIGSITAIETAKYFSS
jgi:ATP-binding cassette subfamily B protein